MIYKKYVEIETLSLKKPIAIVGLPGIGLVGKIAVETIIDYAKPLKIADAYSFDFPPRVIVDGNGIAKFLKTEIYLWKRDNNDILLLTSDAQPQSLEGQYTYADEISKFFQKLGVKMIIACAANVILSETDTPKVHVTATSEQALEKFLTSDNVVVFKHGSINGENGIIPVLANEFYKIDGVCLLAETSQFTEQILKIDPKASRAIVNVLNTVFSLNVDLSSLNQKIKEMNLTMQSIRARLRSEDESKSKPSEETRSYIS